MQIALSDLEGKIPKPKVYPYLVHCIGWPKPRHYHPELELYPPDKFRTSRINWIRSDLSFRELDKKYQAILFYKSQTRSSAFYLFSFARENELFGEYPQIDLSIESLAEDKGQVSFTQADNYFFVRLDKPKKLSRNFGALAYLFGYSSKTAFAQMPKIRIITAGNKWKVFNGRNRIVNPGVLLELGENSLTLKIPRKLLGDPDYILTSLKAYHGNLSIDAVGFRKIKVSRVRRDPATVSNDLAGK